MSSCQRNFKQFNVLLRIKKQIGGSPHIDSPAIPTVSSLYCNPWNLSSLSMMSFLSPFFCPLSQRRDIFEVVARDKGCRAEKVESSCFEFDITDLVSCWSCMGHWTIGWLVDFCLLLTKLHNWNIADVKRIYTYNQNVTCGVSFIYLKFIFWQIWINTVVASTATRM